MECNKDEGLRAKEIAETNFTAKDLARAKKFALKAQNLCPSLEGIDQLITTLDVYLASEIEVHGEKDWYAIMRVDASADDETLKKQYRKLALQVHPDKNKSIGAEGAFQLISQAWSVLSDKTKRLLYDQKRKIKGFQQKTSQTNIDDNVLGTANRFYDFASSARKEGALGKKNYSLKRNACGSGKLNRGSNDSVPTKKRRGIGEDAGGDHEGVQTGRMGASEMERVDKGTMDFLKSRMNFNQFNFGMEFSQLDIWKILIEKTKVTIGKKLEEWKSSAAATMEEKENKKKKQKLNKNDEKKLNHAIYGNRNQDMLVDCQSKRKPAMRKKGSSNDLKANSGKGVSGSVSIDVPDPDFHDFDKDRTEKSIQGEQIWATYGDEDGMPRYYMLVRQVISLKPFKIYVSFLTSRTNSEFGQLNWVNSGFTKSCGDFRVGRYEIKDTINIFSHRVRFEKGPRGVIKIIPRKGEIWALYKNWSADWDENTPDEVIHQYDMVEILDDYSEEQGVSVIPLVKVAGFKAVFCQHRDPREVKRVSREEMFRFSHQVPSYILTGEEAQNAPKGCHELDPAAIPLELLKVITDSQEEDKVMESAEKSVSQY